ncbi:MAG: lipid-binding SYLF domain-containing protein, partial [Arenimonas sp.]|nr:lipid-binding SYLF domain-containing protein [Arenimonas sp.]
MRRLLSPVACLLLLLPVALPALAGEVEDKRAIEASRVLSEVLKIPEESIPANLLQEAQAVAVIPDVILVFRTQRGVDSIVNGKFTLGADASVAAGPVWRTAQASTDAQLK